jgi:hypothetical protein
MAKAGFALDCLAVNHTFFNSAANAQDVVGRGAKAQRSFAPLNIHPMNGQFSTWTESQRPAMTQKNMEFGMKCDVYGSVENAR